MSVCVCVYVLCCWFWGESNCIYVSSSTEHCKMCRRQHRLAYKMQEEEHKKIGSAPKKLSSFHFAFEFLLFFFFHTISLVCSHSHCSSHRKGLLCVGFICAKFGEGFTKRNMYIEVRNVGSFFLFFIASFTFSFLDRWLTENVCRLNIYAGLLLLSLIELTSPQTRRSRWRPLSLYALNWRFCRDRCRSWL